MLTGHIRSYWKRNKFTFPWCSVVTVVSVCSPSCCVSRKFYLRLDRNLTGQKRYVTELKRIWPVKVSEDSPQITLSPVYYVGAKEHTWRDLPTLKGNCSWPSSRLKWQYSSTIKRATFYGKRKTVYKSTAYENKYLSFHAWTRISQPTSLSTLFSTRAREFCTPPKRRRKWGTTRRPIKVKRILWVYLDTMLV